ncbi:hypothetical protein Bca4012_007933 [Brassica carinata]
MLIYGLLKGQSPEHVTERTGNPTQRANSKAIVGLSPEPQSRKRHIAPRIFRGWDTCHKAATTLLKPPLEGMCRKIRSPPLFTDMQDAADTLNGIHRKTRCRDQTSRIGW